jgi:hypothetical protein
MNSSVTNKPPNGTSALPNKPANKPSMNSNSTKTQSANIPILPKVSEELKNLKPNQQEDVTEALKIVTSLNKTESNRLLEEIQVLLPQLLGQVSPNVAKAVTANLRTNLNSVPQSVGVAPQTVGVTPQSAGKKNQKNQKNEKKLKNNSSNK